VLENRIDHGVQQQAALALCKIYGVIDQCGRVYCNRASVEENKAVKHYWLAKLSE
jgi:ribosomal protein S13